VLGTNILRRMFAFGYPHPGVFVRVAGKGLRNGSFCEGLQRARAGSEPGLASRGLGAIIEGDMRDYNR
jgi:hypothetical protein